MTKHCRVLGAVVALALAVCLVTGPTTAADKAAEDAVQKLADLVGKKDAKVGDEAKAIAKKFEEVTPLMETLALKSKGGVGLIKPPAGVPDGMEALLINKARKEMTAKDLADLSENLTRTANYTGALAEVALLKAPARKVGNKDPDKWVQFSKDMKEGSAKLNEAVAKKDTAAVKTAIQKLNQSCADCHAIWKP